MSDQAKQLRELIKNQSKKIEIITFVNQKRGKDEQQIPFNLALAFSLEHKKVLYIHDELNVFEPIGTVEVMSFKQFKQLVIAQQDDELINEIDMIIIETNLIVNQVFIEKILLATHPVFIFDSDPKKLPLQYEMIKFIHQMNHDHASVILNRSKNDKIDNQLLEELIKTCKQCLNFNLSSLSHEELNDRQGQDGPMAYVKLLSYTLNERLQKRNEMKDTSVLKKQIIHFNKYKMKSI